MTHNELDLRLLSADEVLTSSDERLVDVLDTLLARGVTIRGELWLTVADVELVFLGIDLILANPDTIRKARASAQC